MGKWTAVEAPDTDIAFYNESEFELSFTPDDLDAMVEWLNRNVVPLTAVRAALQSVLTANYARVLDERRAKCVLEEFMQRLGVPHDANG